ncbi:hypothetical protein GWA97_11075 [Flavobacterium sp. LaA7.5]|nr:hypothetical protein [Flavobacterium salilacus subsp. altitudinum]
MSKFVTGKDLEEAICDIIWKAEEKLLIVSPYIKLDNFFKKLFDKHQRNPKVHLIVLFGKNQSEVRKSMSEEDFDYFKKFPNISIIHIPNLHAKYFGNEKSSILTSINLYDYSFKNNIEFGVHYIEKNFSIGFSNDSDFDAWNTCIKIARENNVVFIKRPIFEHKRSLIIKSSKNYVGSETLFDSTDVYYGGVRVKYTPKKIGDFPDELDAKEELERPKREDVAVNENPKYGYCIRTGERIPFNPKQPLSRESWKVWSEFGNVDFPEKYCHKTGEKSNGKTSMRNPIL